MRELSAVLVGALLTVIGPMPLIGALVMVVAAMSWAIRWEASTADELPLALPIPVETDPPAPPTAR